MGSPWHTLIGTPGYTAGASGTVTLPPNAVLLAITAHASVGAATATIFGGDAIPIVNGAPPWCVDFKHALFAASTAASRAIVFTNTDSYFVHYVTLGNAS